MNIHFDKKKNVAAISCIVAREETYLLDQSV